MSDKAPAEERAALVWCPFPDVETAREIASTLVQERLSACANIMPAIEAVFAWQGEVSNATECAALFKTTARKLDALTRRLEELHPYETPAIMGWLVDQTPAQTMVWLNEATR